MFQSCRLLSSLVCASRILQLERVLGLSEKVSASLSSRLLSPRFSSSKSTSVDLDNEAELSSTFENRNPVNLEKMLYGYKPGGYELDSPSRNFWYKIVYEVVGRNIVSRVVHHTGGTVVTASTAEFAIQKQLISTQDYSAADNLGRIMAQRCLESGVYFVSHEPSEGDEKRENKKAFFSSLENGGVQLKELDRYESKNINHV